MESESPRIVVIGASATGLRAAARARRLLPRARISVLDQSTEISISACGLPYLLSGDIQTARALMETQYGALRDAAFFAEVKRLEVRTRFRVDGLDTERREVRGTDLAAGSEETLAYDFLVIATGGEPLTLPGMGSGSARIRAVRGLEDVKTLRSGLEQGRVGSAVVIGGGFIGCETAEAFGSLWGAEVTLLEATGQVLPHLLDADMAGLVATHLRSQGVALRLGQSVQNVAEVGESVLVETGDGKIEADAAVCALGVRPAVAFASAAGLRTGERGGLVVDDSLRTSSPDIFAGGDCVELLHHVSGRQVYLPLGSLANRHGRMIGNLLAGKEEALAPVTGSAAVKVFEMNVACTGLTESAARSAGLEIRCAWGTFEDKPAYYPDSEKIHLKVVYEVGTRRLLGLQAVGAGAVVGETDLFSALLQQGAAAEDLLRLEFAYSPPYTTALDPLYQIGAMILNREEDGIEYLAPDSSLEEYLLVDVREEDEVEREPVDAENRLAIPLRELGRRAAELPDDRPLLLLCARGLRSYEAVRSLKAQGRTDLRYLAGGAQLRLGILPS